MEPSTEFLDLERFVEAGPEPRGASVRTAQTLPYNREELLEPLEACLDSY